MKPSRLVTGAILMVFACLLLLVMACTPALVTSTVTPTREATAVNSPVPESTPESEGGGAGLSTAVAARTPIPVPTPGYVERAADEIAYNIGLGGRTFFGLTAGDWADLVVAVLIIVAGYFIARLLANYVFQWILARTPSDLDNELLRAIDSEVRWLVTLFFAAYAVARLSFLNTTLRTIIDDIFFLLVLIILTSMVRNLIEFAADRYKVKLETQEDRDRLNPVIVALQRFAIIIVLFMALSIALVHFGANTNTLYVTLLLTTLIVALAAREVISDALSGFIILVDQPFRVGDAILIKEQDTWGTVIQIGTRTTRILTRDNREVIVPNSKVAKSKIINYTYPDPKYRLETEITIAFGTDIELVRQTATEAVRSVKDVLGNEPVEVIFFGFNNSGRKMHIRWWIASYENDHEVLGEVNGALETAFAKASITIPYDIYDVRMQDKIGGSNHPLKSNPETETQQDEIKNSN